MALAVGTHLRTPDATTEIVVVRATFDDGAITCAGSEMSADATAGGANPDGATPVSMGKRYFDEASGIEVLVVKPGVGPLTFAGRELELRAAKALPASD